MRRPIAILSTAVLLTGLLAGTASAGVPHEVDQSGLQPPLNPDFTYRCFASGGGILCQGIFDPVVGCDDVVNSKPNPEGLLKIRDGVEHKRIWYVGDTVDDARASRAADVPFIGIAATANPRYNELVKLLRDEGAIAILDDINQLEAAIAQNR